MDSPGTPQPDSTGQTDRELDEILLLVRGRVKLDDKGEPHRTANNFDRYVIDEAKTRLAALMRKRELEARIDELYRIVVKRNEYDTKLDIANRRHQLSAELNQQGDTQ